MRAASIGHDLYLKTMDANGKATVTHHRVWDGPWFVASQQQMHDEAERGKSDGCRVSITDRTEYLKGKAK